MARRRALARLRRRVHRRRQHGRPARAGRPRQHHRPVRTRRALAARRATSRAATPRTSSSPRGSGTLDAAAAHAARHRGDQPDGRAARGRSGRAARDVSRPAPRSPSRSRCARTPTSTPLVDTTKAVQQRLPGVAGRGGRQRLDERRGQRPGRLRPVAAATFSLPVTLVILLDRVRRDRGGRRADPAGAVRGRRGDRVVVAGLARAARLGHDLVDDPADGHGGRRRLLAVLRQAGPRRTARRAQPSSTPSRSPRRPRVTRCWCRARR